MKSSLPLRFRSIDCHVLENATRHITKQYEQTKDLGAAPPSPAPPPGSAHETAAPGGPVSEQSDPRPDIPDTVPRGTARLSAAFQFSGPQLVLRRGQKFTIELAFDRPYDKLRDDIIFTFQFGKTEPDYTKPVHG